MSVDKIKCRGAISQLALTRDINMTDNHEDSSKGKSFVTPFALE